jgi:hypothetical protein
MAYDFNGINQSLTRASAPVTAVPLTLACWFNPDLLQDAALCAVNRTGSSVGTWFALFTGLAGVVTASTASGGNQSNATTTATYTTGSWNHCCGVFTTNSSRTIYLNGSNEVTNTASRTPASLSETIIGARRASGIFEAYFNGKIAEVGIWNAALTAQEVASLAKGMTCEKIRPQNLVFYAPLVRDLINQKGGLTITNNNGATVIQHPRVYA